jgi:hypothetical protein
MSGGDALQRGSGMHGSPRSAASQAASLISRYTSSPTKKQHSRRNFRSSSPSSSSSSPVSGGGGGTGAGGEQQRHGDESTASNANQVLQLNIVPRMFNEAKLMDELPPFLRRSLKAHAARELLSRIPLLRGLEMPGGVSFRRKTQACDRFVCLWRCFLSAN